MGCYPLPRRRVILPFVLLACPHTFPDGTPVSVRVVPGALATEDLAFDAAGHVVGSDGEHLWRAVYGGAAELWLPGLAAKGGMDGFDDGDLAVSEPEQGVVWRVSAEGGREPVATGLTWPNGVAVDDAGAVWFTEPAEDRVWVADPVPRVVSEAIRAPNGVAFAPDGSVLVASMYGDHPAWRLDPATGEVTQVGPTLPEVYGDGIAVAADGRVVLVDVEGHQVLALGDDGPDVLYADPARWMAGLARGSGLGGWDADRLYVSDQATHEVLELAW
ncbi:MAG: SMP-30/gluconolactonase/LRE family protein [Myxococcales bacterium]|nr:SMP-30/gluconolactonase/LRE family protein [Myxococcales bacterium]